MRTLRALTLACTLFATVPASAQTIDLSKVTCKEFLESGQNGITIIWAWLYGYYADQEADPIIDFQKMAELGKNLADHCKANPTVGLIDAAEPIYEKK